MLRSATTFGTAAVGSNTAGVVGSLDRTQMLKNACCMGAGHQTSKPAVQGSQKECCKRGWKLPGS